MQIENTIHFAGRSLYVDFGSCFPPTASTAFTAARAQPSPEPDPWTSPRRRLPTRPCPSRLSGMAATARAHHPPPHWLLVPTHQPPFARSLPCASPVIFPKHACPAHLVQLRFAPGSARSGPLPTSPPSPHVPRDLATSNSFHPLTRHILTGLQAWCPHASLS